jgi:uncharacterized membrane protein YqjE
VTESELTQVARRLYASLVEGLNLRFDLFALELEQERKHIVAMIVASVALVCSVFMLLLWVNAALLIVFWETHRLAIAFGSIGFYAALLVGCGLFFRSRSRSHGESFESTRRVLNRDRQAWLDQ